MEIKKYTKKPLPIEAIQTTKENRAALANWLSQNRVSFSFCRDTFAIMTLEGEMTARYGDYVIKGVEGEFYPCKKEIFEKTYEEVK